MISIKIPCTSPIFLFVTNIIFYENKFYERIKLRHNGLTDGVIAIKQYAQITVEKSLLMTLFKALHKLRILAIKRDFMHAK